MGAAKASTTSAYADLGRLPGIFAPKIKEPNHFCTDLYGHRHFAMTKTLHAFSNLAWIKSAQDYSALYDGVDERFLLDGSTTYLYSTEAAANIFAYNPRARVIILLRDPVRRAWSEYKMNVSIGLEYRGFRSAVRRELSELGKGRTFLFSRYIRAGLYAEQVNAYLEIFPRGSVFVDVVDRPGEAMSDVIGRLLDFLGCKSDFTLGSVRENSGKWPANKLLNSALYYSGLKATISRLAPGVLKESMKANYYVAADDRASISDVEQIGLVFAQDVRRLQECTGLDLQHWLPLQAVDI